MSSVADVLLRCPNPQCGYENYAFAMSSQPLCPQCGADMAVASKRDQAATVISHAGHDVDDGWCHTCCVQKGEPEPRRCPECSSPEPYFHKSHCSHQGQYLPGRKQAGAAPKSDARAEALLRTAALAGWAARPRDPQVLTPAQCDVVSKAAAGAALDLLAEWRAQGETSAEESVLVELPRDNGFLLVDPAEVCSLWEIDTRLAYENGQLQTQIVLRSGVSLTASIPLADVRAALGI